MAVEQNPSVVAICESMFKLPPEVDRLTVLDSGVTANLITGQPLLSAERIDLCAERDKLIRTDLPN